MRRYYVYIMASKSRVLYIGVTGDIWHRVLDHKNNVKEGFTSKYRCHRLVYCESFSHVGNAISREKQLKAWLRERKIALIRAANPTWEDLSLEWYERISPLPVRTWDGVEKKQVLPPCTVRSQDDKLNSGH